MRSSLLEGGLKRKIASAFKGRLTHGIIRREVPGGRDALGDATSPTVATFTFEGIRESFSAVFMVNAQIPETDVSILVLLGSTKPSVTPKQDDKVYLKAPWNQWYKVRRVLSIDPAGATANLQAYEVPAPV